MTHEEETRTLKNGNPTTAQIRLNHYIRKVDFMDEKIIIKSKNVSMIGLYFLIVFIAAVLFLIPIIDVAVSPPFPNNSIRENLQYTSLPSILWSVSAGIAIVGFFIIFFVFSNNSITITDKRIYGVTAFRKRVDLPLDSVSAVGTATLKTITVATSAGTIKFSMIANNYELHETVNKLLIDRQSKTSPALQGEAQKNSSQSSADELKKYKDLLDAGVISQEEFDAKKKQLLGL